MTYRLETAKGKHNYQYMRYMAYVRVWYNTYLKEEPIDISPFEMGHALRNQSQFMLKPFEMVIDVFEQDGVVTASYIKKRGLLRNRKIVLVTLRVNNNDEK